MSTLWFVRHASTAWSERQRLQGWAPIGLSARGVSEAHEVGRVAASLGVQRVLASPLRRALETAQIVARYVGTPVQVAPELCELHYGALTGCTAEELHASHPLLAEAWQRQPWQVRFAPRNGALDDLAAAVARLLAAPWASWPTTLCVTHGHVIRVALTRRQELAPRDFWCVDVPTGSFWPLQQPSRSPRTSA